MALPVISHADTLIDHIANTCGIVLLVFRMYGMELNFLPGKSAVILKFKGVGKKRAVTSLHKSKNLIRVQKLPEGFSDVFIGVVDSYKHLGTQISFKGMACEVVYRCGLMRAETAKLRTILRNSKLEFSKKIHLIQAYLLSKGAFQCSTWAALSATFYRRFHGCILGMYRDALGVFYTPGAVNDLFSDEDIIFKHSLIYPWTLIRMQRLLLFFRLAIKDPPFILNFILTFTAGFCEGSWAECLQRDLTWLSLSPKFSECAQFSLSLWVDHFRLHPTSGKAIKAFCMSPFGNIVSHHAPTPHIAGLSHTHFCSRCPYGCDSDQQLSLHLFRKHGVKDPIRRYIFGSRCPICLKEFWVRENVLNHIRRGRTPCLRQVLLRGPIMTASDADGIDNSLKTFYRDRHRKGLRRHALEAPCTRVAGPLLPRRSGPARVAHE